MIYVLGSLRNRRVPEVAEALRRAGFTVFDDWHGSGYEADDKWREYEQSRGRSYRQALDGALAKNVYDFDKRHLDAAHAGVIVLPAGRSAHMELGYLIGKGTPAFVLFEGEPERWDMMYRFATVPRLAFSIAELIEALS